MSNVAPANYSPQQLKQAVEWFVKLQSEQCSEKERARLELIVRTYINDNFIKSVTTSQETRQIYYTLGGKDKSLIEKTSWEEQDKE